LSLKKYKETNLFPHSKPQIKQRWIKIRIRIKNTKIKNYWFAFWYIKRWTIFIHMGKSYGSLNIRDRLYFGRNVFRQNVKNTNVPNSVFFWNFFFEFVFRTFFSNISEMHDFYHSNFKIWFAQLFPDFKDFIYLGI